MSQYILEMNHIRKEFLDGTVVANNDITLKVRPGEIHAICGENGAGKSVLMQILNGLYQPTSGTILFKGKEVAISSPSVAVSLGIGMVYQHFMLIDTLTVAENMVLGFEPTKGPLFDLEAARQEVLRVSQRYNLKIDPDAKISELSVGVQQRVEILKVLFKGADLLVFDEPSAVLTPQEVEDLGIVMKNLVSEGKTILFISHKLKEVLDLSDNITVIRRGKDVGQLATAEASREKIANLMVGRPVLFDLKRPPVVFGPPMIQVSHLSAKGDNGLLAVKDISFDIKEGEILGIAGIEGNGQTQLVEVLAGLRKVESGSYLITGKEFNNKNALYLREHGLSHVPEDRYKRAAIAPYSIEENIALGREDDYARGFWIDYDKVAEDTRRYISKYDVRPTNGRSEFASLSGGNQQKVIIARELERECKFIIAAQPTRGVDIGAIELIHNTLLAERSKKKAILLVSAELGEIMALSDRIAVMYSGNIVGILDRSEATPEKLGILMSGGKL